MQCNASKKSYAELDEASELDIGDLQEFGALHGRLKELVPSLRVFGGCCGTDSRHINSVFDSISRP